MTRRNYLILPEPVRRQINEAGLLKGSVCAVAAAIAEFATHYAIDAPPSDRGFALALAVVVCWMGVIGTIACPILHKRGGG